MQTPKFGITVAWGYIPMGLWVLTLFEIGGSRHLSLRLSTWGQVLRIAMGAQMLKSGARVQSLDVAFGRRVQTGSVITTQQCDIVS